MGEPIRSPGVPLARLRPLTPLSHYLGAKASAWCSRAPRRCAWRGGGALSKAPSAGPARPAFLAGKVGAFPCRWIMGLGSRNRAPGPQCGSELTPSPSVGHGDALAGAATTPSIPPASRFCKEQQCPSQHPATPRATPVRSLRQTCTGPPSCPPPVLPTCCPKSSQGGDGHHWPRQSELKGGKGLQHPCAELPTATSQGRYEHITPLCAGNPPPPNLRLPQAPKALESHSQLLIKQPSAAPESQALPWHCCRAGSWT